MKYMKILIVVLPFLSFLLTIVCGRLIGSRGTSIITILIMVISLILALTNFFYTIYYGEFTIIEYFAWIEDGSFTILSWLFIFDPLTSIMLVIVLLISTLVHIYSVGYMFYDPHLTRFMSYLTLFTFFMIMLVTSGNFIQLFLGWEGVGLASYLLINFWFTRLQANKSAIKAVIVNKFGDFAFLIAIIFIYDYYKSLDFGVVFPLVYKVADTYLTYDLTTEEAIEAGLYHHLGISNRLNFRSDDKFCFITGVGYPKYKPEYLELAFNNSTEYLKHFFTNSFLNKNNKIYILLYSFEDYWFPIYKVIWTFCYNIYILFNYQIKWEVLKIYLIGLSLVFAAIGKSAQVGLHTWLPDAMEGPTPVSALIHAATMVTAGIFLLARCSWIFHMAGIALVFLQVVGAITAFFAGIVGLAQNDLKKVIAYSTCSQLGYMAFTCGAADFSLAMFHLSNHAFFKALLFLCAGSVIHGLNNEQDMRRMGSLNITLPLTYTLIIIGSLALMGFPFLTGFYSKDIILEHISLFWEPTDLLTHLLGLFAAFLTAFYSIRLLYLTFLTVPKGSKKIYFASHESNIFMTGPLLILGIFSIFIGYLTHDLFIGFNTTFWDISIATKVLSPVGRNHEMIPQFYKILPLIFTILGSVISLIIYINNGEYIRIKFSKLSKNSFFWNLHTFINKKWFFDMVYNSYIIKSFFKFGYTLGFKIIDQGFIQYFGPKGLINLFLNLSNRVSYMHSGYIYHLFLIIFIGLFFLLIGLINPIFYEESYLTFYVIKWIFYDIFLEYISIYTQIYNDILLQFIWDLDYLCHHLDFYLWYCLMDFKHSLTIQEIWYVNIQSCKNFLYEFLINFLRYFLRIFMLGLPNLYIFLYYGIPILFLFNIKKIINYFIVLFNKLIKFLST